MSGTGLPTRMACCGWTESINALSRLRPAWLIGPGHRRVASRTRLQRLKSEPGARTAPDASGGAALLLSGRKIARLGDMGAWASRARRLTLAMLPALPEFLYR